MIMTIKEAISLLDCGTSYEIKGIYSGKIYYSTWINKEEHVEQYYNETTTKTPFYAAGRKTKDYKMGTEKFYAVIGIWMHDYHLCKPQKESEK